MPRRKSLRRKVSSRTRGPKFRRNPETEAVKMYEAFTGQESTGVVEVKESVHYHSNLAAIARLEAFKLRGVRVRLKFGKDTYLATNETGTQLFIRGGDQSINLREFNEITKHPVDAHKESVVLGEIDGIWYRARKPFLSGSAGKGDYWHHKFGEESGNRPYLIYDTRSKLLSLSGGSYYIKRGDYDGRHSRGIVD